MPVFRVSARKYYSFLGVAITIVISGILTSFLLTSYGSNLPYYHVVYLTIFWLTFSSAVAFQALLLLRMLDVVRIASEKH
jgi:hypothetical protein